MSSKEIIKKHTRTLRYVRLAKHLGVSMSLMSDSTVNTAVAESLEQPAMTQLTMTKGGSDMQTGVTRSRWGRWWSQWYVPKNVYRTHFSIKHLGDDLAVWLGTAWHELGHVLWSPYGDMQITMGLNLLEDARIEALIMEKFPKTRGALLAMLKHMVSEVSQNPNANFNYAWAAGRVQLPSKVRAQFRKHCATEDASEIDEIFRDYLSMGSTLDIDEAIDLARRLDTLIGSNGEAPCESSMQGLRKGEDLETDTRISQDTINQVGASDGEGDKEGESLDSGEIEDVIDESLAGDSDLQSEIAKLKDYLDKGVGVGRNDGVIDSQAPTGRGTHLAQQVRRIATSFNDDSAKGLVRKRDSGRLKPMRYEQSGDIDTAFDQWEPGLSQEMDVWLLMDISGSMDGKPVNEVVYALQVGLKDVANVEVVLFDMDYFTLPFENNETRMVKIECISGTDPVPALSYIYPRAIKSGASNRLVIMYTDGQFSRSEGYEIVNAYFDQMRRQGVTIRMLEEQFDRTKSRITLKPEEHYVLESLNKLPSIVMEWTKNVLGKPI